MDIVESRRNEPQTSTRHDDDDDDDDGLPFLEISGLQLSNPLLSQEQVKLRTSDLAGIYRANPNKSPLKMLAKRERWRIQGLPTFWGTPYYLWKG